MGVSVELDILYAIHPMNGRKEFTLETAEKDLQDLEILGFLKVDKDVQAGQKAWRFSQVIISLRSPCHAGNLSSASGVLVFRIAH